jgi:hypothetical protein
LSSSKLFPVRKLEQDCRVFPDSIGDTIGLCPIYKAQHKSAISQTGRSTE